MNIIELTCFLGLPSMIALVFLLGTPGSIRYSVFIGAGSALASLLIVILYSYGYRLLKRRPLETAPVPMWALIAVLLSAGIALYFRLHHHDAA